MTGTPVGKETLHSLLCADDQVIFAQNNKDMSYMIQELQQDITNGV